MDRTNKMLIDASHPEETRVVVLRNGRVEEFDYESAARKLLRGNIYLAKVTRVEPSLQAAFVDYGGNRHGFLAFNEIHPDYYQIPVADREALKQEEAEEEARAEQEADERAHRRGRRGRDRGDRGERRRGSGPAHAPEAEDVHGGGEASYDDHEAGAADHDLPYETGGHEGPVEPHDVHEPYEGDAAPLAHPADERLSASVQDDAEPPVEDIQFSDAPRAIGNVEEQGVIEVNGSGDGSAEPETVEQVTLEEDALEEVPERPRRRMRQYKIQEVIKRRQILLIQVVKEERGNKGAALTTYISLAGRYTVLMPNTGRGGGISRKITQPQDRKRLKAIAEELDVAEGMGLIIRTAGAARTKQEIKRDYEYLLRLWESVRDLTLTSTAPCLVYEEGNLIKRSIRDLYSKDIDGVVVAGETAHREARDFMTMLMPGHGDHVARYDGSEPLFTRYGIERQLNALFSPYVNLRSGGYLVINQTEALVSVDVNSGKSTREFSIEETALNTNLEAAEEIARQLKLRDLAGLIVVDFIDMEEKRNNRSVERRLKDALRHDRARIQVGRISHFGLLEMSRQRLRTGMLEGSTSQCPHCQGTGIIRSVESVALAVLRGLEDNLMKQPSSLAAVTTAEVALYILNHKRSFITEMERRHGITITVDASDKMQGANFAIERTAAPVAPVRSEGRGHAVSMDWGFEGEEAPPHDTHRHEHADEPRDDEDGYDDRGSREDAEPRGEHRHGQEGRSQEGRGEEGQGRSRRRRRRRGRRDGHREGGQGEHRHGGHDRGRGEGTESDVAHLAGQDDGEPGYAPQGHGFDHEPSEVRHDEHPAYREAPHDKGEHEADDAGGEADVIEGGERRADQDDRPRRGRRRGRRGGRGRGRDREQGSGIVETGQPQIAASEGGEWGVAEIAVPGAEQPEGPEAMVARRWDEGFVAPAQPAPVTSTANGRDGGGHSETSSAVGAEPVVTLPKPAEIAAAPVPPIPAPPRVFPPRAERAAEAPAPVAEAAPVPAPAQPDPVVAAPVIPPPVVDDTPPAPPRKGWWQRRFGG